MGNDAILWEGYLMAKRLSNKRAKAVLDNHYWMGGVASISSQGVGFVIDGNMIKYPSSVKPRKGYNFITKKGN